MHPTYIMFALRKGLTVLSYNKKAQQRTQGGKQRKGLLITVIGTSTSKNILSFKPASTPTGKKQNETLQFNYFETNILLLPHPNSPESRAALPATAISPSIQGQAHTQKMRSSFI